MYTQMYNVMNLLKTILHSLLSQAHIVKTQKSSKPLGNTNVLRGLVEERENYFKLENVSQT
jgi:hypothetical protein